MPTNEQSKPLKALSSRQWADGEIGRRTALKMRRPLVMRVRVSPRPYNN